MINFIEIFNAWKRSKNPTEIERANSQERLLICQGDADNSGCEHYTEILKKKSWSAICGSCGCPINRKIFSMESEPCPKGKWKEVDAKYGKIIKIKDFRTIL
jgi:hypothetical protein